MNRDGKTFHPDLTAFLLNEPPNWLVCQYYAEGFHRQNAQQSFYSMTARFGRDHADAIAELLPNPECHHLYVIRAALKPRVRERLRDDHGIWRGSLFPDLAGAAETGRSSPDSCSVAPVHVLVDLLRARDLHDSLDAVLPRPLGGVGLAHLPGEFAPARYRRQYSLRSGRCDPSPLTLNSATLGPSSRGEYSM